MAETEAPETIVGESESKQSDAEMREMIRALLDKVDSLERQIATQGDAHDGEGAQGGGRGASEAEWEDGFVDDDDLAERPGPRSAVPVDSPSTTWRNPVDPTAEVPGSFPVQSDQEGVASAYGEPPASYREQVAQFYPGQQRPAYPETAYSGPYVPPQPIYAYPPQYPEPSGVGPHQGMMPGEAIVSAEQAPDQGASPSWRHLSEGNIGRYGTGLMASVLVIMGVWVGAQLVWNQVPVLMRMLALLAMGVVTEGVATFLVVRSEDGTRNGFLTSLSATGAIVSFLSLAIGGMLYGLYGPPLMGVLFLVWFFGQTMVARLVQSRLFYAVTYVGGAVTMILEATQVISATNLMTSLAFSLTALVIPLVGLVDRRRNPAVPYASSVFSMASAYAAIMLAGIAWGDRSTLITTPEFTTMVAWLSQNVDIALLAATGFVSGCAVVAGTKELPPLADMPLDAIRTVLGTVGLLLMLKSATCLPWDCGFVPNALFCLSALLIMMATGARELRLPTALLTAFSMWHLLDGTEETLTGVIGTPVAGVVPALATSCVLSLVPAARRSRSRVGATLAFVAMSCLPVLTGDWSLHDLAYAVPVTVLAVFACVTTFRLAMAWLGMQEDEMAAEAGRRSMTDPRSQDIWLRTRRRMETARRLVPLGMAMLASLSLMPVVQAGGSPVAPDVAPAMFSLLASLHMMAGIGFGMGWGLPGTEHETRRWRGVQGQYSDSDDMIVARTARGWNLAALILAYAWAIVAHGLGAGGLEGAIGAVAYSVSLIVIPSTLIAHATSRRSLWSVIASTVLSHLSFGIVAGLWVSGNVGLVASCLSIALALGFVAIGFKSHKGDIRMTGLVTMILFVLKIALIDLPKASTTGLNVLLLVGTGILCFAISFAYNRIDRMYGEDEESMFEDAEGNFHGDASHGGMEPPVASGMPADDHMEPPDIG